MSAEMLPGVGGILRGDGGGGTKGGGGDCMAAACSFGTILIATMLRDVMAVMAGFNARELRCLVRAEAELCRRIEGGIVARDRERTLPRVAAQAGRIVKEGAADRQKHWSPLIRAQSCARHEIHPRKASGPHEDRGVERQFAIPAKRAGCQDRALQTPGSLVGMPPMVRPRNCTEKKEGLVLARCMHSFFCRGEAAGGRVPSRRRGGGVRAIAGQTVLSCAFNWSVLLQGRVSPGGRTRGRTHEINLDLLRKCCIWRPDHT